MNQTENPPAWTLQEVGKLREAFKKAVEADPVLKRIGLKLECHLNPFHARVLHVIGSAEMRSHLRFSADMKEDILGRESEWADLFAKEIGYGHLENAKQITSEYLSCVICQAYEEGLKDGGLQCPKTEPSVLKEFLEPLSKSDYRVATRSAKTQVAVLKERIRELEAKLEEM